MISDNSDTELEYGIRAFEDAGLPSGYRSAQLISIAEQLTSRTGEARATASAYAIAGTPQLPSVDDGELQSVLRADRDKRGNSKKKVSPAYLHQLASRGDVGAAVELVNDAVDDVQPSVRVAASTASIALEIAGGTSADEIPYRLVRPLVDAMRASDDQAEVAEIMLAGLDDVQRQKSGETHFARPSPHTRSNRVTGIQLHPPEKPLSIGVHGTFSRRRTSPMVPAHRFYQSLRHEVTSSLYPISPGHFRWTSRYRTSDRAQAAEDLQRWTHTAGNREHLDTIYAHSHGGNVVLDALSRELITVDFLVLLSVPAVRRSDDDWDRINRRVGRALSYRTGFDPVIAVDRLAHNIGFLRDRTEATDGPEFPGAFEVFQQPAFYGYRFGFTHSRWLDPDVWSDTLFDDLRSENTRARAR